MKYKIYQIETDEIDSTNLLFEKNIVQIVLNHQDNRPEVTEYLSKIMSAVKLSISIDCKLHYVTETDTNWFQTFKAKLNGSKCIFFGIDPIKIGIWFQAPTYRYFSLLDNDFIFVDRPEIIRTNSQKKSLFWAELQLMFKNEL